MQGAPLACTGRQLSAAFPRSNIPSSSVGYGFVYRFVLLKHTRPVKSSIFGCFCRNGRFFERPSARFCPFCPAPATASRLLFDERRRLREGYPLLFGDPRQIVILRLLARHAPARRALDAHLAMGR